MFIRLFAGEARLLMLLGVVVAAGGCARPPQQALPEEPEAVSSPLATPFPGSGGLRDAAEALETPPGVRQVPVFQGAGRSGGCPGGGGPGGASGGGGCAGERRAGPLRRVSGR